MNMAKRNSAIDVLKGVGIITVIIGHTYGPLTSFIYLFHMPIFFMSAGYCYSFCYSNTLQGLVLLVKKRMKSLWRPYAVVNTIFLVLNNYFLQIGLYTTNESLLTLKGLSWEQTLGHYYSKKELASRILHSFLFNQSTQLTGATWFLEVLFFVTLLFAIIDYFIRKINIKPESLPWYIGHTVVSIVCLTVGNLRDEFPILKKYRFATILIVLCIYEMGVLFRLLEKSFRFSKKTYFFGGVLSGLVLVFLNRIGYIELSSHSYSSVLFLILCSVFGWIFVYGISFCIASCDGVINKVLSFFGKNSLPILLLHLVFFKPVTAFLMAINHLEPYCLASFPVLTTEHGIWIIYAFVNLFFCTLLIFGWRKMRAIFENG